MKQLTTIQAELKCPKGSLNKFGNYKYRSAEQILESVKPILAKHEATLILSDTIIEVGSKLFLKATATLKCEGQIVEVNGFAELGEHKGMSSEQCTGTASSYARKYALNGLFLIDETESDPDSKDNTKQETKNTETKKPKIEGERFLKAIEAIRAGEFTAEELQAKFDLNEVQKKSLLLVNQ
jgi:hypothetical protein